MYVAHDEAIDTQEGEMHTTPYEDLFGYSFARDLGYDNNGQPPSLEMMEEQYTLLKTKVRAKTCLHGT